MNLPFFHKESDSAFFPTQDQVRQNPALLQSFFVKGVTEFRRKNLHAGTRYDDVVKHGQRPLVVIIKCVDSRYPAEVLLNFPVGTIITHKSVGGLIRDFDPHKDEPDIEWVTMLFAVRELGTPCVTRKGHTGCGCAQRLFDQYVKNKKSKNNSVQKPTIIDPLEKWINAAMPMAERVIGDDYSQSPSERLIRKLEEEMVRDDVRKIRDGFDRMIELGILPLEKKPTVFGNLFEMSDARLHEMKVDGNFKSSDEPA